MKTFTDSERPNVGQLAERARQSAHSHQTSHHPGVHSPLLDRLQGHSDFPHKILRDAYRHFLQISEEESDLPGVSEWLLDNFYVVEQELRQVRENMPAGYYHRLPKLDSTDLKGYPRAYAVAWDIITCCNGMSSAPVPLDVDRITRFVQAYQQVSPLTMGELWALPTMLRMGTLELLALTVAEATGTPLEIDAVPPIPRPLQGKQPEETIVANCIRSLRMLGTQDWKSFFEEVSGAEATLRTDPAGVYPRMDFETRDRYRKVIEELAWATGGKEEEIAQEAIALAEEAKRDGHSPRMAHVGFYLIDQGRAQLEARLGYDPPWNVRLRHWLFDHPTLIYLSAIGLLTLLIVAALSGYGLAVGGTTAQLVGVALLTLLPASALAVNAVNLIITCTVPPRILPKLDFSQGIPADCRTMVVIPALLSGEGDIKFLSQQLERHYLGNADPKLYFALLTDFADAQQEHRPEDEALIEKAKRTIQALNQRYGRDGAGPFYLFHRPRLWNEKENCWMGWERKRGKLAEFNRLLLGAEDTSYNVQLGDLDILPEIKYVITLDADTVLPRDTAQRLIGTLAHPLNRAVFDTSSLPPSGGDERGGSRVTAGYTVLQPRTEVKPSSANQSRFTRIFASDAGLDLYTRAVSDVYQDFFGEGIYVGKGIYEVEAFERSLRGRVPENALLSHDLFEGIHGRAALVTDMLLFEDYPPGYLCYAHRMHRWVRGDWQLLPWLLPRVPHADGGSIPNTLSTLDRWKIIDNIRRSLRTPALMGLWIAGWLWLPGSALFWTLVAMLASAAPLLTCGILSFSQGLQDGTLIDAASSLRMDAARWALNLTFLPYKSILMLDAILTTLARLTISHKRLLQWTTAAHTVRLFGRRAKVKIIWRQMSSAPVTAVGLAILVGLIKPQALLIATPLLLVWFISPQIAAWISRPIERGEPALSKEDRRQLRNIARRTWLYFERFVGPKDHWLPPDHFQEQPRGIVAHHTSPTNIGLMLLSTLSAYDLGYLGVMGLTLRLRDAFDSLGQLERYRGHFLNWYDTRELRPLAPRYVSTVDSGNLAGCLLALQKGLEDVSHNSIPRWQRWQGLHDTLSVLAESVERVKGSGDEELEQAIASLEEHLAYMCQQAEAAMEDAEHGALLLADLGDRMEQDLRVLLSKLIQAGSSLDAASLHGLRLWSERAHRCLRDMREERDMLLPWLTLLQHPPALLTKEGTNPDILDAWQALRDSLPGSVRLDEMSKVCQRGAARLKELQARLDTVAPEPAGLAEEARSWCEQLARDLESARVAAGGWLVGLQVISEEAETYFQDMDFRFLFNPQRRVFHLGHHVDTNRLDENHYDLLASEARIASLVAIAKGDAPQSHWLHLGRPLFQMDGKRALLSWNGSMFEYLMPDLLTKHCEGTLLDQTNQVIVQRQIAYARRKGLPWGISESGYYRFDAQMNYQYRGFGVPGLGRKRGLSDDLVIAPYASLLALSVAPRAVMGNLNRLAQENMLGNYGFYEARDYTPSRLLLGEKSAIVASYYAHHHGMSMLSLVNYLRDEVMARRFHADTRVQSVELLLGEQIPRQAPVEEEPEGPVAPERRKEEHFELERWTVPSDAPFPQVHFLSNGRYGVMITGAGGGYSVYSKEEQEIALTRWRADTTLDDWGTWIYVEDRDTGALWSAGRHPIREPEGSWGVHFYPHQAKFWRLVQEVCLRTEITVSPDADVEVRRVTLTNRGGRPHQIRLTSYGEVALAPQAADRRHPAFNKLFIESEFVPEVNALLFHRRPRSAEEKPLYLAHLLMAETFSSPETAATTAIRSGAYESDRARFLGRGQSSREPTALGAGWLSGATGATLDPIMALGQEIELAPYGREKLAFVTLVAESRAEALRLAQRYRAWPQIERAFERARSRSEADLRGLDLDTGELEHIQVLLSALLYPHSALRAAPEKLAANRRGQSGLWSFAISGDYPILLVRLGSREEIPLARELLRAHAYWRKRRIKVDLVILNQKDVGYAQELQDRLHQLITRMESEAWLHRRGGIFLLLAGQMDEAAQILLETAARVVLDGDKGSLADQLTGVLKRPPHLPPLVPTGIVGEREPTPALPRPKNLQFDNGFGGFSPDGREYQVYLEPGRWTPHPWINVIANPTFGFLVSEAGSGYTWAGNSGENRLTPWHNDPVSDPPGEALYLRDEETGEVWSPTPLPAREEAPYLVRHGAGYSIFEHHSHGLKQHLRLFAAPDGPVKVIHLRLENVWKRVRRITATFYAEWVLGVHRDDAQQHIVTEYDPQTAALLARNEYNEHSETAGEREGATAVAFLVASKEPHGLTADRAEFLGHDGSLQHPAALDRVGLRGRVGPGLDPCAAVQLHVDLAPGEAKEVFFLLGQGENRAEALRLIEQYRGAEQVETTPALSEVEGPALSKVEGWKASRDFWEDLLGTVTVETPDPAMDLLLNRWLLYQALACRVWGRSALYQSSGAFGFRDQLQDSMALLHEAPEVVREHILRAACHQFEEGDVLHWWHPMSTRQGPFLSEVEGSCSKRSRGVRTRISDDLLWLPYVVSRYVEATGDAAILGEKVPFRKGKPLSADEEERYAHYELADGEAAALPTLYEHCRRALEKGSTKGAHGLPLIGAGDWNDGLNRVGLEGKGESVWLGWFLYATLTRFAPLCERMGDGEQATDYLRQAQELRDALEENGWDGDWYLRAYYDDGAKLGSSESEEGQIMSLAQSWAVLSGAGDEERAARAMEALAERLIRPEDGLILLFAPPFDKTPRDPGYIKGYPPGIRENGGQYTHAALWAVWAYAKLGQGDRAGELFRLLNPIYHSDTAEKAERYRVEPYVVAADVYSTEQHLGRGGWTWYTGSSGWMYRLGLEAILGLQKEGDVLRIDPCIPRDWPGYVITYRHGESLYRIQVENPEGVNRGVERVTLDGADRTTKEIPLIDDGEEHQARVVMG